MSDNKELDRIHVSIGVELNKIRSLVIEIERLMRVMHQERHPVQQLPPDLTPTQPLDPEVRLAIDETP